MPLPALRNVDVSPIEHDGELMICLQDPEGLVETPVLLSPAAFAIATFLNGTNDVLDIQYQLVTRTGRIVPAEDIRRIVNYLDEHGFLKSSQFDDLVDKVRREFQEAPVRPAHLAGRSYPENAEDLRSFLDSFFVNEKGPKVLPGEVEPRTIRLKGLIAPHIDFERGGAVYAHAYLNVARDKNVSRVLIFGVSHAPTSTPFVLTRKSFETPFGTLHNDIAATDRLAQACRWDPFADELVHRSEHSIEFQAVFLGYLLGSQVKIVPVLCGGFPEDMSPSTEGIASEIRRFLDACRELVNDPQDQTWVIAGADLAHVGKRFGDPIEIDDHVTEEVRARDFEDLGFVKQLDPEGWYASVMKDGNKRKVCGISAIYSLLKVMQGQATQANILSYDHAPDPFGGIVSFASVSFVGDE